MRDDNPARLVLATFQMTVAALSFGAESYVATIVITGFACWEWRIYWKARDKTKREEASAHDA